MLVGNFPFKTFAKSLFMSMICQKFHLPSPFSHRASRPPKTQSCQPRIASSQSSQKSSHLKWALVLRVGQLPKQKITPILIRHPRVRQVLCTRKFLNGPKKAWEWSRTLTNPTRRSEEDLWSSSMELWVELVVFWRGQEGVIIRANPPSSSQLKETGNNQRPRRLKNSRA